MTMASRLVMQAYGASSRRSGSNPPSRRWPRSWARSAASAREQCLQRVPFRRVDRQPVCELGRGCRSRRASWSSARQLVDGPPALQSLSMADGASETAWIGRGPRWAVAPVEGADGASAPGAGHETARDRRLARPPAWRERPRKLRSEGYTDLGRGTYSPRPRRATSRLSFCARPKRLSSARKPPSSLRPSSVGASSSAWRRTRSPRPGWPQPPAAARRSAEPRASPERRSRASCRRRSTPGSPPVSARSHFSGRRLHLL